MRILVINAGSSSVKFGVIDTEAEDQRIFKGEFERFREGSCTLRYRCGGQHEQTQQRTESLDSVEDALAYNRKLKRIPSGKTN